MYIYAYMDLQAYVVMLVHACTAVLYIGRTFELYISMCVYIYIYIVVVINLRRRRRELQTVESLVAQVQCTIDSYLT